MYSHGSYHIFCLSGDCCRGGAERIAGTQKSSGHNARLACSSSASILTDAMLHLLGEELNNNLPSTYRPAPTLCQAAVNLLLHPTYIILTLYMSRFML